MNSVQTREQIERYWESEILPALARYIEVPNLSPDFDPEWEHNGLMLRAVEVVRDWIASQNLKNSRVEVFAPEGRTPLLLLEVEGEPGDTVICYGHLDKQPPSEGWAEGLGPYTPVIRDGKLYGRGGADDGYSIFAAVAAIKLLQSQGRRHPRIIGLVECCEESESLDLEYYLRTLASRIGNPGLIICLDSGCLSYDRLWATTSLRGATMGVLTAEVLTEGVHSGDGSGIVASSFRILRQLLNRIEDVTTGKIIVPWLHVEIPPHRVEEAGKTARVVGADVYESLPFVPGMQPVTTDVTELLLNRTWRPALAVTGQRGMPDVAGAGNVMRASTSLKLSIRLPPSLDVAPISLRLKELFEMHPPYGAKVTWEGEGGAQGWDAPAPAPWLLQSLEESSRTFFGNSACYMGDGGSIGFLGMLGERYPDAQFLVTGLLGPASNAHGPNEFLHIQAAKDLTACVAHLLVDCAPHLIKGGAA